MIIPECQNCGACCAYERLWVEVTESDFVRLADLSLTEPGDIEPHAMRVCGPEARCVALNGRIGMSVVCTVYEKRPDICRKVRRGSLKCIYMLGFHKLGRPW